MIICTTLQAFFSLVYVLVLKALDELTYETWAENKLFFYIKESRYKGSKSKESMISIETVLILTYFFKYDSYLIMQWSNFIKINFLRLIYNYYFHAIVKLNASSKIYYNYLLQIKIISVQLFKSPWMFSFAVSYAYLSKKTLFFLNVVVN